MTPYLKKIQSIIFFSLLLAMLLFSSELVGKENQGISLKQTVETRKVLSVHLAPDGQALVYRLLVPNQVGVDEDAKSNIHLYQINQSGETKPFVTGLVRIGRVQWSSDSKDIYFLAQRHADPFVSIYRMSATGGEAQRIIATDSDISDFTLSHDAKALSYLAKGSQKTKQQKLKEKGFNAKVYEESVEKSKIYLALLNREKLPHIRLDTSTHPINIRYHPKNRLLLALTAKTPLVDDQYMAAEYQVLQQTGERLTRIRHKAKLKAARWSPDAKRLVMIAGADKNDPVAGRLFSILLKNGRKRQLLKNYPGDIKDFRWINSHKILVITSKGTQSELLELDVRKSSWVTLISQKGLHLITLDTNNKGEKIYLVASKAEHPPELFVWQKDKLTRLSFSNSWLNDLDLPKQESIEYQAKDGLELQGILVYPLGYKKKHTYPLIVMVHGGPESHVSDGWIDRYSYPVKYAASQGFMVLLPNYRGSSGRGESFAKLAQGKTAGKEFGDLVDGIDHLVKIGMVDKKRVAISGVSYGGYAAAWGATALSSHFAASVMLAGYGNQISKFGTTDISKELYQVHLKKHPWDDWQRSLKISPIYYADQNETPLLILHGEKDPRVHPSQALELYRYIKMRSDTAVRLVLYPEEAHGHQHNAAQLDAAIRMMRWFDFYLLKGKGNSEKPEYFIDIDGYLEKSE